jgi:hypothetical protein
MKRFNSATILRKYVELHNKGVLTGNFNAMLDLFTEDAEMHFEGGQSIGPFVGRTGIARGFSARPPDDTLVIIGSVKVKNSIFVIADYGWSIAPQNKAGQLRATVRGTQIAKLTVTIVSSLKSQI